MGFRIYLALALALSWTAPSWSEDVQTTSRVFQLRHVSVMKASEVVQPMLSEHGSMTVQPHSSRITVQDTPEVVSRVADALSKLDRSPDEYRIRVELLEGTNGQVQPENLAQVPPRVKRMFPFERYRGIGSATFEGEVGSPASADIGEGLRVSFLPTSMRTSVKGPWGIPDLGNRIQLEELRLQKLSQTPEGEQKIIDILRTTAQLSPGQEVIIGAGGSEESNNGHVLILRADPVGGP